MDTLVIRLVDSSHSDLHELIAKLDADLLARYPADEIFGLDFTAPGIELITFAVAYCNGEAAGCGAIRPLDKEAVELKRVYVDPAFRRQGVAAALLDKLEGEAKGAGYTTVLLETGAEQPESIGLYSKLGYKDTPRFGIYMDS